MILSVSRRTDIPWFYSQWFYERVREGYVLVRNPFYARQVSRVPIRPDVVDCMVFWTKNPIPMMDELENLEPYPYYFQFTLTGYGRDVEPRLPDKRKVLIPAFQKLAKKLGPDRMVWRYDPVFINSRYTVSYHLKAFGEIARALEGCTDQVVISFLDFYRGMEKSMGELGAALPGRTEMGELAGEMSRRPLAPKPLTCQPGAYTKGPALTGRESAGFWGVRSRGKRTQASGRSAAVWKALKLAATKPVPEAAVIATLVPFRRKG